MNSALFICSLVLFVIVCNAASPRVRYINSIPQFGSATFSAALPHTALFSSVSPGAVSSYSSLSSGTWNFYSTFNRKVSAGSDQYDTDNNNWYTIYTAQTTQRKLKNFLLEDSVPLTSGNKAAVRVVNLLQFNFPINASAASSSNSASWSNIHYASATTYTQVTPGSYLFDWSSSSLSKRNVEQGSNCTSNCGGPWWFGIRRTYTIYVLPTITIVVSDGTTSSKREVRSKRAIQKSNALSERLSNTNEVNEAAEEVANNEESENEVNNESIEEGDQSN